MCSSCQGWQLSLPSKRGWVVGHVLRVVSPQLSHGAKSHLICSTWIPIIHSKKERLLREEEGSGGRRVGWHFAFAWRMCLSPSSVWTYEQQAGGGGSSVWKAQLLLRSLLFVPAFDSEILLRCAPVLCAVSQTLLLLLWRPWGHVTTRVVFAVCCSLLQTDGGHPWNASEMSGCFGAVRMSALKLFS